MAAQGKDEGNAVSNDCNHVLVIGAANLDIKGIPEEPLMPGSSIPGQIRTSLGGVARNIAENLARLDVDTVLLTAVGNDPTGERILGHAAGRGIDISHALVVEGGRTGAYMALLQADGALNVAMDDMRVLEALTPAFVRSKQALFAEACLVVIDANLRPEAIDAVIELCDEYDVALCADPTSSTLAHRLSPHLHHLYMIPPNVHEVSVLTGLQFPQTDREAAQEAATQLVEKGVEIALITLGEFGVVYNDGETKGHIPAIQTQIVDETGAGDAMTAAIIFGLLEDIPLDECVRLGVTAASLTLRTRETVRRDLSVELLYDELVI